MPPIDVCNSVAVRTVFLLSLGLLAAPLLPDHPTLGDVDSPEALAAWHESVEPDSVDAFHLRLFVGGLTSDEVLIEHVDSIVEIRRNLVLEESRFPAELEA